MLSNFYKISVLVYDFKNMLTLVLKNSKNRNKIYFLYMLKCNFFKL